jgi:halocarboxylic acid dehydrogenase DehI
MSLARVWEGHEVAPELRRIYSDIRSSFDLPFVPTLFKLLVGVPEYLRVMWDDLGPVARSREFQTASKALEEFARSVVISGGWRFSDQQRVLAGQKFSSNDVEQLCGISATFARVAARLALFTRLMQKGYSGGQAGRVSNIRQASALSRMVTLHVPSESDAGLRVWFIYNDIKRTLGMRHVFSLYRVLSPFPAYLASVWLDSKKTLGDPAFLRAREDVARRAGGLLVGIPVKDHRAPAKQLDPRQWRDIEEIVDSYARLLPQFALLSTIWQRSFANSGRMVA